MLGKFVIPIATAILIVSGCAPRIQKPIRVCPGKRFTAESLSALKSRSENAVSLRANGQCRLEYYIEGEPKPHKENFQVKLWVNPPAQIYLQGDVAFDAKGIVLGSNENEFWLAMKPKEISGYWWGRWSQRSCFDELMISPKILLEALGIVEIGDEKNWSLSNKGAFDILTKRDGQDKIIEKIYIDNCDYLVKRIEYFDAGRPVVVTESEEYEEVSEGFFVPAVVKIAKRTENNGEDLVKITLGSIKPMNFTDKQKCRLFTRPEPKGFKHIYKIVDGDVIEQIQE